MKPPTFEFGNDLYVNKDYIRSLHFNPMLKRCSIVFKDGGTLEVKVTNKTTLSVVGEEAYVR